MLSKGENLTHGQRATNKDKKRNVLICLQDPELKKWSDRQIGEWCGVDHKTVSKYAAQLGKIPTRNGEVYVRPDERKYLNAYGSIVTMKVSGINQGRHRTEDADTDFEHDRHFEMKDHWYNEKYLKAFGKRFKRLREHLKLSQSQMGKKLNLTRQRICQIENGTHRIDIVTFHEVCKIFRIKPHWLLGLKRKKE